MIHFSTERGPRLVLFQFTPNNLGKIAANCGQPIRRDLQDCARHDQHHPGPAVNPIHSLHTNSTLILLLQKDRLRTIGPRTVRHPISEKKQHTRKIEYKAETIQKYGTHAVAQLRPTKRPVIL